MTVMHPTTDLLGLGIYTTSEAALYARVPTSKLSRWVLGTSKSRPTIMAQIDPKKNDERWVTFLDFVQCLAIRDIRRAKPHLHMDKIRETIEMAQARFGIKYPFARKHTTYVRGDQISLEIDGYGLVEATGPHKSQLDIRKVVEQYLQELSYDADGLANQYVPFEWKGHRIVLNPHIRFGEPCVNPGRYSVVTLCEAYEAEGGYDGAAQAYNVNREAVEAAREYYYGHLRAKAA